MAVWHWVLESSGQVIFASSPNRSDSADVFVRRAIFGMFPGLTDTAVTLPPSTADAEGQHWLKQMDFDGDFCSMLTGCVNQLQG